MTPERVRAIVAEVFDVAPDSLTRKEKKRDTKHAWARFAAIAVLHNQFGHSLSETGRMFGTDHSLARYARNQVNDRIEVDRQFKSKIKLLLNRIATERKKHDRNRTIPQIPRPSGGGKNEMGARAYG